MGEGRGAISKPTQRSQSDFSEPKGIVVSLDPDHFREKNESPGRQKERLVAKFLSLPAEARVDLVFISVSAVTWSQLCPNSGLEILSYGIKR